MSLSSSVLSGGVSSPEIDGLLSWLEGRVQRADGPRPLRLLLIEDRAPDRRFIEAIADGWAAVECLPRLTAAAARLMEAGAPEIDVVLLDLGLPDASGLDGLRRLRACCGQVPVVVITGALDAPLAEALQAGAQDFLLKDALSVATLLRAVVFAVERQSLLRDLEAERASATREARDLEAILSSTADAVAVVDEGKRLAVANETGRRLLLPALHRGDLPLEVGARELELPVAGAEARWWYRVEVRPSTWKAQPAWVLVGHDLTEEHAAARAQEALREGEHLRGLGALAAEVAHEVNNPLALVAANLQLLQSRATPESDEAELLGEADDGVRRIVDIVSNLRTWAKADPAQRTSVRLLKVAMAATSLLRSRFSRQAVQLKVQGHESVRVIGNEGRLVQLVANLVTNALDALGTGGSITVTVGAAAGEASITVADDGPGMSAEVLERARSAFFTTKGEGNMGLGLSVCAAIAREHSGDFDLSSVVGGGTEATLRLAAVSAAAPSTLPPPPLPETGASKPRLLLVDDDLPVRRSVARFLRQSFDIDDVESGHAAVERLSAGIGYDLVLCDVEMPDFDGVATLTTIAERWPDQLVALYTGGVFSPDGKADLDRFTVFDKPLNVQRLQRFVARSRPR